jgi:CheY-like chemotaxis protein
MRILIAEDRPTLQLTLHYILPDWGYRADIVPNGQEAVDRALSRTYDLVILDLQMPVLDGISATHEIRTRSSRYVPVLALTAHSWDRDRCLAAGMDDFLVKPWDIYELHDKILSLTVKAPVNERCHDYWRFRKEKPMNAEHLQELRNLDQKGLTKLIVKGSGGELVVHKNIQNKIAHDFVVERQEISEFLDRSEDKPGLCHLYRCALNVKCLLPEELERMEMEEDERMGVFGNAVLKAE